MSLSTAQYSLAHRFGFGVSERDILFWTSHSALSGVQAQIQLFLKSKKVRKTNKLDTLQERAKKFQASENERERRVLLTSYYQRDCLERSKRAISTETPFIERLVFFWSNHFTVCADRRQTRAVCGPFENEAIRQNLFGSFAALLRAVVQHPAMLLYLDNVSSTGENSRLGQRAGRGLNENLAREILELHTIGDPSLYQQEDVLNFAKCLTGWSVNRHGQFAFSGARHEPTDKVVLGRIIKGNGRREAEEVLAYLAGHPATARHICLKLCRHFLKDVPSEQDIQFLMDIYQKTGGNLTHLYEGLAILVEQAEQPLQKYKTPNEYVLSVLRSTGLTLSQKSGLNTLKNLGQQPFMAGSPKGWPDVAEAWGSGDLLNRRIEWAYSITPLVGKYFSGESFLEQTLGGLVSPKTAFLVKNAPTRQDGVTLALISPEFQRR